MVKTKKTTAKTGPKTKARTPASKAPAKKTAAKKPANKNVGKNVAKKIPSVKKSAEQMVSKLQMKIPQATADMFFLNGTDNQSMEKIMTQGKTQMEKATQDAADIGRESTEALMKCGTLFMKGFEDIMRETAALAQNAAEKQAQYVKEALSTKTLNEWSEMQSKIAQANFDDFMSGATKISELSVKLLSESAAPFNAQMTKAMKNAGAGNLAA